MIFKENVDYEFVPNEENAEHWNIRILTGNYSESVIAFGHIKLNDNTIDDQSSEMSFNFDVISTPDTDLSVDDIDFQSYAGDMLISIIESSLQNHEAIIKERGADEKHIKND